MKKLSVLALVLSLMAVSSLSLQAGGREGKLGISGAFDYATYAMSDINAMAVPGQALLSSGMGGGGAITYGFTPAIEAGIIINYLTASSDYSATVGVAPFDLKTTVKDSLPIIEILLGGNYVFPDVATGLDLKIGLGLGFDMLNGTSSNDTSLNGVSVFSYSSTVTGSGFGALVSLGGEYFVSPQFSLGLDLGYRYASISPITISSSGFSGTLTKAGGANAAADYSGLNIKVGGTFYIDMASASK